MTADLATRPPAEATRPDALDTVRAALLETAQRDADGLRTRAASDASALLEDARREAASILEEAQDRGRADGAAIAAANRARSRRAARAIVLRAQREAYDELRRRGRSAVGALRQAPDYIQIRRRLARLAQARAGLDGTVDHHPEGGVVAEAPGRRVDCSLLAMADRAFEALGAEVEDLWAQ